MHHSLMVKNRVEGVSVVVIRGEKSSISRSYGYADLDSKSSVDERTIYRAASLGKPILCTSLFRSLSKGKSI